MKKSIQAWKDEDLRLSLTKSERALLPMNPAGIVELTDEAIDLLLSSGKGELETESCCWHTCKGSEVVE